MKKTISSLALSVLCLTNAQVEQPKLVVGIVVDQMRPDYLYRYNSDFSNDGFKRLMREGFNFKNTHYNYMPTYTAPGHSSLYTGTTPAIHGIVGNSWYHRGEKDFVYCTSDNNMQSVGIAPDDKQGRMSPHRLKATTVTDALKLNNNFRGKVIGISVKDRGAILPAGHFADAAYWMDKNCNFISSTFYMKELPQWVKNYNAKKEPEKFIKQGWKLLKDAKEYDESTPDFTPYEAGFPGLDKPVFPYDLKKVAKKTGNYSVLKTTPYGNDMVAHLAKEAIEHENLGKGEFTDFLAVSFSSTDYVGHNFATRSMEIQDTYLRLDLNIADLLNFLDEKVGKGNYLLFLSADHAAAENPNFLLDHKYHVKNLDYKAFFKEMQEHFAPIYGKELITNYSNQNIYLNDELIKNKKWDYDKIVREVCDWANEKPFVARTYSRNDILRGNPTDYNLSLIERGYDPKQNGDIVVLLDPQYMEYGAKGTTHGTTYLYDTHVPNIWYGWKVKPGESFTRYNITDVAPTLSQKLSIPMPNGSQGYIMKEVLP
ncbi:alkaline phosphatase PafA [Ornithobacterium rhinotracheale]|uniref:Putative AP superfamily protein n=2 Tax=Ornithobacterium rhinotracheale TaxID=28251 RepID=I4A0S5_ORNRL|nr:alkaline phosphatase PafA [Ornithobacterium rhinotracheale]AFL97559.1 putative AP superfamily protein [Ornithobacterium rhinotracheale DSM 15997]AIP98919.1 alkaline phosphatase [Ornithobacterium rhinotracheale ORT-UMN 88]KGB66867.1 alkaline phosphatase [Ornithobacterium rhinotracheale H06-030791]MBN3661884.1 alkaline phosphatase family protein [Ornithobacterium rhinotracheale]MCK0195075.1 alkaline phosphatase family protein [Ornithobacterium rhinotracheale]